MRDGRSSKKGRINPATLSLILRNIALSRKAGRHIPPDTLIDAYKLAIAARVLTLLESTGWTQTELIKRSGLSRATINDLINCKTVPSLQIIAVLESTFKRPILVVQKERGEKEIKTLRASKRKKIEPVILQDPFDALLDDI